MNGASCGASPPVSAAERKPRGRPVLFVIDDDPGVVRALRDDLGRRFGGDFRVIGESSAAAGLAALRRLADGCQQVALLIADHGLTEMPGTEFLARAHEMHPLARRVLAGGAYINFLMDEGQDRVEASYRGNYSRLAQIKRRYDPENTFHINQNIQPAP